MSGDALVASEDELQTFNSAPPGQQKVTPALRGVLAEIATSGVIRYPWPLVRTLLAELMEQVLVEFEAEAHVEVGPSPAGMGPDESAAMRKRLQSLLAGRTCNPPFTLQRIAELLLAPGKQYGQFLKLALALEKLLVVVSALPLTPAPPARPRLADLPSVNENPPPPDMAASSAAQTPQPTAANGPLANGGDDAARAVAAGAGGGFSSTMHAAAESAFLNTVFSEAGPESRAAQADQAPAVPVVEAGEAEEPLPQPAASAPQVLAVPGDAPAAAAAPKAAPVMPVAVVAPGAASSADAQPAVVQADASPTADDPDLEALLEEPAAEPMDLDSCADPDSGTAAVAAEQLPAQTTALEESGGEAAGAAAPPG